MIVNTKSAEHYIWGTSCDGCHLVKNNSLSVIQERMPPNSSEKTHIHHKSQQFFFILFGEATFEINLQTYTLKKNEGIYVPPEQSHKMLNLSETDLCFLVISQPMSHGDRTNLII